jgi:cytochrome d ubiquinol oxidase subunit II
VTSGALALAGVLVMRSSGLDLLRGLALVFVVVSGVAGLGTLVLCWAWRFGLARLTAALAVAAVVVGWAVAQAPRLLPGLTVVQAAAGPSTLLAIVIAVCGGAVVLVPSLVLLFTLFLRGRLDTPEHPVSEAEEFPGGAPVPGAAAGAAGAAGAAPGASSASAAPDASGPSRVRGWGGGAIVALVGGAVLLVFSDAAWAHAVGALLLVLCAVSVFALVAPGPDSDKE